MKPPKLRRNGDGRAFAVYPNSGGRRAYFGTHGTREADQKYRSWLADFFAALANGEPQTPARTKGRRLCGLAADYLSFAERYYSGSREFLNVVDTMELVLHHSGHIVGDEFGPNALRAFQSHLASQVKCGRPRFARTTINAHINRVRRFIKWCQSRELVRAGLLDELRTVDGLRKGRTPAREPKPVEPVAAVVWRATLPFMSPTIRDMTIVQFWCGMRPGEVCGLMPCEVDRSGDVWTHRPTRHKTAHRDRALVKAIPPPAQTILRPYLSGPPDRPVFLNTDRAPYISDNYGSSVRRAARGAIRAHIPVHVWHPNQLRHAILTEIRDRLGLEDAQTWAGHSRSATTLVYTWTASAALKRIAASISPSTDT